MKCCPTPRRSGSPDIGRRLGAGRHHRLGFFEGESTLGYLSPNDDTAQFGAVGIELDQVLEIVEITDAAGRDHLFFRH